jgi:putative transposase
MAVLTELKNRGVKDMFLLVCDRLKGLPHFVNAVSPHGPDLHLDLIRVTFRHASRHPCGAIA